VTPDQLVKERLPALQEAASHIAHQLTRYPTLRTVLGG
jgi:IclR family pca regulon transcriptional regulator